jgi:AcrR family transcriptional regulator
LFSFAPQIQIMTTQEKTVKREHILHVAEQLFAEQGFDGTSIRDIAQQAGVNLAMINYYFGSKENLMASLLEYRSKYTLGLLEELNKDEKLSPWDKMDRLVDFYVEKILANHRMHNIMAHQYNTTRSDVIRKTILDMKLRNFEQIKKIIQDGQKKKFFRKVDIELTMGTVMGSISQLTLSRGLYCSLLRIDEGDDENYRKKVTHRLKIHLKQLLHAHLDIKNEEQ